MRSSSTIYINSINQKIFDNEGLNIYKRTGLNQIIPPGFLSFPVIYNATVRQDNPGMVTFEDEFFRITDDGMYSINAILALESEDQEAFGLLFTAEIEVFRSEGNVSPGYVVTSESARIEATNDEEFDGVRRITLSTTSYLLASDVLSIRIRNLFSSTFNILVVSGETFLNISRIY